MSDTTYQPKVYRDMGGDRQVIAGGGILRMEPGSLIQYANPTGASDYYVDGNVSATGSGTIDSPYSTFAEAVAASNTSIALTANRWWARRNRIFIMGDDLEEDIVLLPEKCDVIGLGSSDNYQKACIRGNHVPIGTKVGCRFFNVRFRPAASGDLWTLASITGWGLEFWNCIFDAHYEAFTAPSAIDMTAAQYVKIMGCEFLGAFSGDVIDIGAGSIDGLRIIGNNILGGADNGIVATGTMTCVQGRNGLVADNYIQVADKVIDDGADGVLYCFNNVGVSAENAGASAYVITSGYGANNIITCGDGTVSVPSCNYGAQS